MDMIEWWAQNYGWVLATLGILQFLFLTWLGTQFAKKGDVIAATATHDTTMVNILSRLTHVESAIENMPNHKDFTELSKDVAAVKGGLDRVEGLMKMLVENELRGGRS